MDAYSRVVEGLRAALLDERATAVFYALLRDMAKTYAGVEAFAEARKDELDHARQIAELLTDLTGVRPAEEIQVVTPPPFSHYCEGIMIAIRGEKNAAAEYAEIIRISPYAKVNRVLEEIIADEEVHLAKFKALFQAECQNV